MAEAIKHLVFQAGTYDCFIDIFGRSAAATLAVPRRNNAVYVFNDLDFGLYFVLDGFVRYILLEWIRRNENDSHSYDELFFLLCDDVQDMELTDALQSLMTLFVDMAFSFSAAVTELIKSQVSNWIATQAGFIRDMFSNLCWESIT